MPRIVRRTDGLIGIEYERYPGEGGPKRSGKIHNEVDTPLPDKPERPCSNCFNVFQPTVRRRMLCEWCYTWGDFTSAGADE